jgi:hypothetical protein
MDPINQWNGFNRIYLYSDVISMQTSSKRAALPGFYLWNSHTSHWVCSHTHSVNLICGSTDRNGHLFVNCAWMLLDCFLQCTYDRVYVTSANVMFFIPFTGMCCSIDEFRKTGNSMLLLRVPNSWQHEGSSFRCDEKSPRPLPDIIDALPNPM